jgi:hypothetical protein
MEAGGDMNRRELIIKLLESENYIGLVNPDISCGCGLHDLAPCGECLDLDECLPCKYWCTNPKCHGGEFDECYCLTDPKECEYLKGGDPDETTI